MWLERRRCGLSDVGPRHRSGASATGPTVLCGRQRPSTAKRWRPFARRRLITSRPLAVAIRTRKPWVRCRLVELGLRSPFFIMPRVSCRRAPLGPPPMIMTGPVNLRPLRKLGPSSIVLPAARPTRPTAGGESVAHSPRSVICQFAPAGQIGLGARPLRHPDLQVRRSLEFLPSAGRQRWRPQSLSVTLPLAI